MERTRVHVVQEVDRLGGNCAHVGVIEVAVFALLGWLLAFSLAGGTSRLDTKRQLIVKRTRSAPPICVWTSFPPDAPPEIRPTKL